MNNYLKGMASLLDIYATQKEQFEIKTPSWNDYTAIKSDWEKISEDFKSSILEYASEIATPKDHSIIDELYKAIEKFLKDFDSVNDLIAQIATESDGMGSDNSQLLDNIHHNMLSQKDLLKKMNQRFYGERQNVREKESEEA